MDPPRQEARRVSAAIFGNEKLAEVVAFLAARNGPVTAQHIVRELGVSYSMVRDVLIKLARVGVVRALPKIGGSRAAQYYEPVDDAVWRGLVTTARAVVDASHEVVDLAP